MSKETTTPQRDMAFWAICFLAVLFCETVDAQVPSPPPGVSGYTVTVDDSWGMSSQGFYPIRVTVETNPAVATTKDKKFSVSIRFNGYDSTSYLVTAPLTNPSPPRSSARGL